MGRNNKYRFLIMVSISILFSSFILSAASVSAQECPPVIASLMPKNAVKVSGQYNAAGFIGFGFGAGDLPFEHPCVNQTTKFPGRITFDIKHYSAEGIEIFKMQIDQEEAQRYANKKSEFEKKVKENQGPEPVSLHTESLGIGKIIYIEQFIDCSEGVKRSKPLVELLAVAHTEDTAINLEIKGYISAAVARAAAVEVIENFKKANFSALDQMK